MIEPTPDLDLNLELLLNILLDTTKAYMEAFGIKESSINTSIDMLKKYKAFQRITAYYMDNTNECVSFVNFNFDWDKYELVYKTDDPDTIINRKSIIAQTPKQILSEACDIIEKRVSEVKEQRGVSYIKMVFTYSDEVWNNKILLDKVRREAGLVPLTKEIKFSSKLDKINTKIVSSLTENTLFIDYVT